MLVPDLDEIMAFAVIFALNWHHLYSLGVPLNNSFVFNSTEVKTSRVMMMMMMILKISIIIYNALFAFVHCVFSNT
jgi:hypothetical protein